MSRSAASASVPRRSFLVAVAACAGTLAAGLSGCGVHGAWLSGEAAAKQATA